MDPDECRLLHETLLGLAASERAGLLTAALDAFGWRDVLAAHRKEAISALFDAQGRTGTWSAALHDVLATDVETLGIAGSLNVVLPRPRRARAGRRCTMAASRSRASSSVRATRPPCSWSPCAPLVGTGLAVAVEPEDLQIERRQGLDPGLWAYSVSGTTSRTAVFAESDRADTWWEAAQARGRLALCRQIVAALTVMIEQARSHVSGRAQFGRLVGTFQAVRHKLVEAHVATTAADCITATAWESEDFPLAAATAKVVTGKAVEVTAAHTQQLLAGIGFTAAHPYHRFMKRAVVLERMLGSEIELAPVVGRQLMERGAAPRLVQL